MNRVAAISVTVAVVAGCATSGKMPLVTVGKDAIDQTAPIDARPAISSLILLPPSGSDRGAASYLVDLERVLLANGFRVVSSAITSRVVVGEETTTAPEAASSLSDIERALILAQKTGADALLQVASLQSTTRERNFGIVEGALRELPPNSEVKVSLIAEEAVFGFDGRLIDVKSGDILLSVSVNQGTLNAAPLNEPVYISQAYKAKPTRINTATEERKQAAIRQVLNSAVRHLKNADRSAAPQSRGVETQSGK